MSKLVFEAPPEEALGAGEREGSGYTSTAAEERALKAKPGEWAKVYGTQDRAATTRNTIGRWEKKGFETMRRKVVNPKSVATSKYEVWCRWPLSGSEPQTKAEKTHPVQQGVPLTPEGEPESLSDSPFVADVEPPVNPFTGQADDAESTPTGSSSRYERRVPPAVPNVQPPSTPTNFV